MSKIDIGRDYPNGIEPVPRWLHPLRDDVECVFDAYGLWSGDINSATPNNESLLSEDDLLGKKSHIIIVGEGDAGKTRLLNKLREISPTAEHDVFVRLREFSGDSVQAIYGDLSNKIRVAIEAARGENRINIFLDGIDESRRSALAIEKILADEIVEDRGRLVMASRPGDFLMPLMRCNFALYQLCPLQLEDVKTIAAELKVDWLNFFRKVRCMRVLSMCSKPEMCIQIVKRFKGKGFKGESASVLMWDIAKDQCAEHRDGAVARDDAIYTSQWNEEKKAECASWIAAAMRFTGKDSVWTGKCLECPDVSVTVLNLVTAQCPEGLIIETLRTRIFEPLGSLSRFRIGTEELIDFLSAKWLSQNASPFNARQLLLPAGESGPAFSELMLERAVALGVDVGESCWRSHPEAYLAAPECVANIGYQRLYRALYSRYSAYPDRYKDELLAAAGNLASSETTECVKQDLVDASMNPLKARFAARVAFLCEDVDAFPAMVAAVSDGEVAMETREKISYDMRFLCASIDKGKYSDVIKKLLPVISCPVSSHNGELVKGNALHCLFPDFISAQELFNVIDPPLHANWYGAYTSFIEDVLLPGVPNFVCRSNAVVALDWATRHMWEDKAFDYIGRVARQIFSWCWRWAADKHIREKIVDCIFATTSDFGLMDMPFLIRSNSQRKEQSLFNGNDYIADANTRLLVLEELLRRAESSTSQSLPERLLFCEVPLYYVSDFTDMANWLMRGSVPKGWMECVKLLIGKIENFGTHAQVLESLKDRFPNEKEFDIVFLERTRKESAAWHAEVTRHRLAKAENCEREKVNLEKKIADIVCDPENDVIGFNKLCHLVFSDGCTYRMPESPDLTVSSEWSRMNDEQKNFCVRKAKTLLMSESGAKGWEPYSVACAVGLVYKFDPAWVDSLDQSCTIRILHEILSISHFIKDYDMFLKFVERALANYRAAAVDAIIDVVISELSKRNLLALHYCRNIEPDKWIQFLFEKIRGQRLDNDVVAKVVTELASLEYAVQRNELVASVVDMESRKPPSHDFDDLVMAAFCSDPPKYEHSLMKWMRNRNWFNAWLVNVLTHGSEVDRLALAVAKSSPVFVVALQTWVEVYYPDNDKPIHVGAYSPTPKDEIYDLKDYVVSALMKFGDNSAVKVFEELAARFPSSAYGELLRRKKFELEQLKSKRIKWMLDDIKALVSTYPRDVMLVETSESLLEVMMKLLDRYGKYLQEWKKGARDLWNETGSRGGFRKGCRKGESALSDHLARFIKLHLSSLVVNREPEVSFYSSKASGSVRKGIGDIVVEVSGRDGRPNPKVIIEVKGDWNSEVRTGLSDQLINRYLKKNADACGIFLCGCFNAKDSLKEYSTPSRAMRRLRKQLTKVDKKYRRYVNVKAVDCSM